MPRYIARLFVVEEDGTERLMTQHGPWSGIEFGMDFGITAVREGLEVTALEQNGQQRALWRMWDGCESYGAFRTDATPDAVGEARARIWDEHLETLCNGGGDLPHAVDWRTLEEAQHKAFLGFNRWSDYAREVHRDAMTVTAELDRVRRELSALQASIRPVWLQPWQIEDRQGFGVGFRVVAADGEPLPEGFGFRDGSDPLTGEIRPLLDVVVPR